MADNLLRDHKDMAQTVAEAKQESQGKDLVSDIAEVIGETAAAPLGG